MSVVAYITRDPSGTNQHGTSADGNPSLIPAGSSKDISLNLAPIEVESYAKRGNDLIVTLSDGTELYLSEFYNETITGDKNLFLSDNGDFIEVVLEDKSEGMLFASYEWVDVSGKWSAYDDMVFLEVDRIEPVIAPLAAPLLGGLGAAGAAGAAVAGAAVLIGSDDDDDEGDDTTGGEGGGTGGNAETITPTVDDAEDTYLVGEGDPDGVTISGTGEEGSSVEVIVGTTIVTTTVEEDGTWSVNIPTDELPDDGDYETVVNVVAPDGTEYNDIDGPTISIDSEPPVVEITEGTQSVGDVVNGSEQASGTVITGTGEAGATVTLVISGARQTTTEAETGTWSVTFGSDEISTGEYETDITITTTDPYGNSTTTRDVLEVDTMTSVSIDSGLAGGDDIVTAAEAAGGVAITGTAEAGATVNVDIKGVTRTTVADSSGLWSVTYENGTLAEGEYSTEISVTSTDQAGNTATATSTIAIDTDAGYVTLSTDPIEGDDIINAAERSDGVTISGTATPGEEVTVTLGGATGTLISDIDGNWSYAFAAEEILEGTGTLAVTASITDDLGNTEQVTDSVNLDTIVTDYSSTTLQTSDDNINQTEMNAGFTLSGTVEVGSTVTVQLDQWDEARTAIVDAAGNWTLDIEPGALDEGEYTATGSIIAVDAAGNEADLPISFEVDTVIEAPSITGNGVDAEDNLNTISVEDNGDGLTVNTLEDDGTVGAPTSTTIEVGSTEMFVFDTAVPDGTNLVVTAEDDSGNTSSTLVVFEHSATETSTLDHEGLSNFNVETLNLEYSDDAQLTLTESDINALSSNSNTLKIRGDSDDTVTLVGATNDGTTEVNGETFNIYSIGDGDTMLLVEDDVNVVTNVVI